MNPFSLIGPFAALGIVGLSDVNAQSPPNADLYPPYLSEEAMAEEHIGKEDSIELGEGEELREGEDGKIIERGLRRFYKRKRAPIKRSRPRIKRHRSTNKRLQRRAPLRKTPRVKRRPLTPIPGTSTSPPPESNVVRPGTSTLKPKTSEPKQPQQPGETQKPTQPLPPEIPPELVANPQCVWHTSDIMDQRIDVSAQKRLMSMMSRGGEERRDASAMIGAVKEETLAGILLGPRKAVSDRAKRLTPPQGWWQLIPQGELGTCWKEPKGESPMILYRDKIRTQNVDPSVLDHTLRTQWKQCGLPTPTPACSYLVDIVKPPPKPGTSEEEKEVDFGFSTLQVFVTGNAIPLNAAQVYVMGYHQPDPDSPRKFWAVIVPSVSGMANHIITQCLGRGKGVCIGNYGKGLSWEFNI